MYIAYDIHIEMMEEFVNKEMIFTEGNKRAVMPKRYYEQLSQFIIKLLEPDQSISLLALIEQVENKFRKGVKGNLVWYLLYVKQDLQSRNVISIMIDKDRQQFIMLRKNYRNRVDKMRLRRVVYG